MLQVGRASTQIANLTRDGGGGISALVVQSQKGAVCKGIVDGSGVKGVDRKGAS